MHAMNALSAEVIIPCNLWADKVFVEACGIQLEQ